MVWHIHTVRIKVIFSFEFNWDAPHPESIINQFRTIKAFATFFGHHSIGNKITHQNTIETFTF